MAEPEPNNQMPGAEARVLNLSSGTTGLVSTSTVDAETAATFTGSCVRTAEDIVLLQ